MKQNKKLKNLKFLEFFLEDYKTARGYESLNPIPLSGE